MADKRKIYIVVIALVLLSIGIIGQYKSISNHSENNLIEMLANNKPLTKNDIPDGMHDNVRLLLEATFDADPLKRSEAIESLGMLGEQAAPAIPFLINLLDDGSDVRVHLGPTNSPVLKVGDYAQESLSKLGKIVVDPCLKIVGSSHGSIGLYGCMSVLGQAKDDSSIDTLVKLYGSKSPQFRAAAIERSCTWSDDRFVQPLITALQDPDSNVRVAAIGALGIQRDPLAMQSVLGQLDNEDPYISIAAIRAYVNQNDSQVVPTLLRILDDSTKDKGVRGAAAIALGGIPESALHDRLLAIAKDRSAPLRLRSDALQGLVETGDQRFVEPLKKLAKERTLSGRGSLLYALVKLDPVSAAQLLAEIAADSSEDEAIRCLAALELVSLTNGAVDDVRIVQCIDSVYAIDDGSASARNESIRLVAANGKTEAIRDAANSLLKKWKVTESRR